MPIELSPHLVAWTRQLRDRPIPVLADSLDALRQLALIEEERGDVDAHRIDDQIGNDPLATLWILVEAARRRRASQITPVETVTAAIIMMGIGAFFRAADQLQAAEDLLADQPLALEGLQRHLRRQLRASRFVQGGAVHRMDDEIALLRCTSLLHGSAELLLWCHAPALMLQLEALRAAEPELGAAEAEQRVLHLTLADLEQALLHNWHLPERLLRLNDEHPEGAALVQPQRRLIQLATALARHDSLDWDAPDQPPEFGELAELLQLTPAALRQLLADVDL